MDIEKINPFLYNLEIDYMYHLGLNSKMDLNNIFGSIKFVIFTRSNDNAAIIAHEIAKKWYKIEVDDFYFKPIFKTERFNLYKIGFILIISHGIGMPSALICLNEMTKLLKYLKIADAVFINIQPAGGLAVPAGSVVIIEEALNTKLEPKFTSIECGVEYEYLTYFNKGLAQTILEFSNKYNSYNELKLNIIKGKSISTNDFYEEQARLDGFLIPEFTKQEKDLYLQQAYNAGVYSIDVYSTAFAGFCNQLNIRAIAINVTMGDRLINDEILISREEQLKAVRNASVFIFDCITQKVF